jgi:hypothetical protein
MEELKCRDAKGLRLCIPSTNIYVWPAGINM